MHTAHPTATFDGSAPTSTGRSCRRSGARPPVWESDHTLLAAAEDRGDTHLYRLHADGSAAPSPVTEGRLSVSNFDAAGGTIATVRTTIDHPGELYVGDDKRTGVADALACSMLSWEKFVVPTSDGSDEIDCWIMRPADFDRDRSVSGAVERARRTPHPVRRVLLRRGPTPGRRRIRGRARQPAWWQRPARRMGSGDHGDQAPGQAGQRMGQRRRRGRPVDHRRGARTVRLL